MPVALPTAPVSNKRHGFPWKSTWVIGSPPKVGKSKFVEGLWRTTGKLVLHLDLENSTEDLGGCTLQVQSLAHFREIVQTLRADSQTYSAIAVDTLDVLNAWCEEETIAELRAERPELNLKGMGDDRVGYGTDWARARQKVHTLIQSLQMTGKLILVIAHTKVEKGEFSGVNIAIPAGLARVLRGHAQVIGYIYAMEQNNQVIRVIMFAPSEGNIAGSRYAELNNKHIILPLRDVDKDGKGWVDWKGIFQLFGEIPSETAKS